MEQQGDDNLSDKELFARNVPAIGKYILLHITKRWVLVLLFFTQKSLKNLPVNLISTLTKTPILIKRRINQEDVLTISGE